MNRDRSPEAAPADEEELDTANNNLIAAILHGVGCGYRARCDSVARSIQLLTRRYQHGQAATKDNWEAIHGGCFPFSADEVQSVRRIIYRMARYL